MPVDPDPNALTPVDDDGTDDFDRGLAAAFGETPAPATSAGGLLAAMAETIGTGPRVMLRDTDVEYEPALARVTSPEMPSPEDAGRYQLLGEIARGGMGAVLRGRDPDLGRDLAIKVVLEKHRDNPEILRRFVEEAQIGGQLQHPGILPVYDLGQFADKRPYFAMKLVKGRTMAALLAQRGSPAADLPRFVGIFEQIAQTVAYAHARGVIHRDLKPSNVMVGSFGEVQVMDWGLAKVLATGGIADEPAASLVRTPRSSSNADASEAGSILGTPPYMPPEQADGRVDEVDERADVFGLGSILVEILTGRPTYTGGSTLELLRKARLGDTSAALARLADCAADAELIALAKDCIAPDRDLRPRNAGIVASRVTAYLAGVQERLRKAEIAEVEARGREEQERQSRLLTEAKAVQERRARRLTTALAATILFFSTIGGVTWWWIDRQARDRSARADLALADARLGLDRALESPIDELAPWREAHAAARRGEDLLAGGGTLSTRRELAALSGKIERGERDATLIHAIQEAISESTDDTDGSATEAALMDAFRSAGVDPDKLSVDQVAEDLRNRPARVVVELASALDYWSDHRASRGVSGRRLTEISQRIDPDPFRWRIRVAMTQGAPIEARREAIQQLAADPKTAEQPVNSVLRLARGLVLVGDEAAAIDLLLKMQRRFPQDPWIHFDLAGLLRKTVPPRIDEALRFHSIARALRPAMGHEVADMLRERGQPDEAIAILEGLTRLLPWHTRHWFCLGRAYTEAGRPADARAAFESASAAGLEAVKRYPGAAAIHNTLASALFRCGKGREAVESLRTAIRLAPTNAYYRRNLGRTLLGLGELDASIVETEAAIKLRPEFSEGYVELGNAYLKKGDNARAVKALREGVRLDPNVSEAQNNLALALERRGDLDGAVLGYEAALKARPNNHGARRNLAVALYKKGEVDRSLARFREVIAADPGDLETQLNFATVLLTERRYVEALPALRLGLTRQGIDPGRKARAADALAEAERRRALAEKLPAILNEDPPTSEEARVSLGETCHEKGYYAAAARLLGDNLANVPAPANDPTSGLRSNAAVSAALAGFGLGNDKPPPDDAAKAELRSQALTLLNADLDAWTKLFNADPSTRRAAIIQKLTNLATDPALAPIRDESALATLPEPEREAWRKYWKAVAVRLDRAKKTR
jgi:eukaryotic-like serine/threonine-protein kinase